MRFAVGHIQISTFDPNVKPSTLPSCWAGTDITRILLKLRKDCSPQFHLTTFLISNLPRKLAASPLSVASSYLHPVVQRFYKN